MADRAVCARAFAQTTGLAIAMLLALPTDFEQVLLSVPGVRGRFRELGDREMSGRGSFDDGLHDRWGNKGERCK